MNGFESLKRLNRVSAPEGFEDRVLTALRDRHRALPALRRRLFVRRAMAAAAALLLVGVGALNLFVLHGPASSSALAGIEAGLNTMPITEPVAYRGDLQNASNAPGAVYILEQVSEASHSLIRY
jgi:hypothetical protein